jgi:hypothetical protein
LAAFERAAERARAASLPLAAAKVDLLLGIVAKTAGDLELTGRALRRAADTARPIAPALAIEALRTVAEYLVEAKAPKSAIPVLEEALAIAEGMDDSEARQTSAGLCARMLAPLLRAQRHEERAVKAEAAARRLGPSGGAPTEEAL